MLTGAAQVLEDGQGSNADIYSGTCCWWHFLERELAPGGKSLYREGCFRICVAQLLEVCRPAACSSAVPYLNGKMEP